MPIEFKMPQLGETVVEGTVGKWLKAVGDPVREFEPLLEVATDKVDTEIPSPASGFLAEIRAAPGQTVRVGQVICTISEDPLPDAARLPVQDPPDLLERGAVHGAPDILERGARHDPAEGHPAEGHPAERRAAEHAAPPPTAPPRPGDERPAGRAYVTPVVARMAAEHRLDLSHVPGTGHAGRISKKDVLRYLEARPAAPQPAPAAPSRPPAPAPALPAVPPQPPLDRAVSPAPPPPPAAGDLEVPLSRMRQAIVRHMRQSKDTAAHVTTFMEVDLSRVVAYRAAHQAEFAAEGLKLSLTPFFLEAIVAGLKAYPMLNAVLAEDKMIYRRAIHLGLAVDLGEDGLIVPVVKHADGLSLRGLARTVADLAERARARTLAPDDVQGGTFTLTNHGTLGSIAATPIIPMPQVGILGVGAVRKRPVVLETEWGDTIAIRPIAILSLSFDHRAVDGATADRFLGAVKRALETYGA